ncbi:hypothetical protein [Vibrio crassostreae]|uniref:hypothetical protein n=1 Tax=Vibrio crassostreae TaxID=246167 RepID=UPI001B30AF36|nr:hypothetical protein [Vibrio crassostreae]
MTNAIALFKEHATQAITEKRLMTKIPCDKNVEAQMLIDMDGSSLRINMKAKGWWSDCVSARVDFDRWVNEGEVVVKLDDINSSSGGRETDDVKCCLDAMDIKADAMKHCTRIVREFLNPENGIAEFMQSYFKQYDDKNDELMAKRRAERQKKENEIREATEKYADEHELITSSDASKILTKVAKETKADDSQPEDCMRKVRIITVESVNQNTGEVEQTDYACMFQDGRTTFHITTHSTHYLQSQNQVSKGDMAKMIEGCHLVNTKPVWWTAYKQDVASKKA